MKIRLPEIESGVMDPARSRVFYNEVLGPEIVHQHDHLAVFNSGVGGVDVNIAAHLAAKQIVTSYITDDLGAMIDILNAKSIPFRGPEPSHLGMRMIEFRDPDGFLIKVNEATDESPEWLR
ncbi:VOC family protein [Pollutibacter soli]|uniref:VOC family protein n=1 Tax=Pollutibacter soli TaxID=3034157 RepID=UPI00301320B5